MSKTFLVAAPTGANRTKNGRCLGRALERLGFTVHFFDYDNCGALACVPKPLRGARWESAARACVNESLIKTVARLRPDYFLCVKGLVLSRETIREIGAMGAMTIGYWIDDPLDHARSLINAGAYDLYLTNDTHSVGHYREAGLKNVRYFPSAVDETLFRPCETKHGSASVSFVGTVSARRREVITEVLDFDICAYGPGWKKQSWMPSAKAGHEVFGDRLNEVFSSSKVNLNIHNWFGQGTAMNLRLFEVPAAGGFLLTDWVKEIDEHFVEGKHIACWRSIEELRDKIGWFLSHESERTRIAAEGHAHVLKHHTYTVRARELLAMVA